jgi:hypothetical protein
MDWCVDDGLPVTLESQMDAWIEKQPVGLSRPEAIRRLVELGLKAKESRKRASKKTT